MNNEDYIPEEGYDIARDMGKIPPTKDKKERNHNAKDLSTSETNRWQVGT